MVWKFQMKIVDEETTSFTNVSLNNTIIRIRVMLP